MVSSKEPSISTYEHMGIDASCIKSTSHKIDSSENVQSISLYWITTYKGSEPKRRGKKKVALKKT